MASSANVTKYDAGGSGDNYIKDGYIKSVEKVWIDSYTTTAAIPTTTTLTIAKIPAGKKVTGVEVIFSTIAPTSATIAIGLKDSNAAQTADATKFMAATAIAANKSLRANANLPTATTAGAGVAEAEVYLTFAGAAIATTNATISTIVRYV